MAKPAIPPSRKSSRISVRSWRMRRVLCAPRAWRTAISRPRPLALASSRLATLTQLIRIVVQAQRFADDVRVGSEFSPPEPVAEHDLQVVAGSGIVRIECAAQLRVYTEDREVIRGHLLEAETQGLCTTGKVHVCAAAGDRDGLEYPGTIEVSKLRDGNADALRAYAGKIVLNADQFGRVWVGNRVQQRGVNHAVDGGGSSDTQGHSGDGNERESRGAKKHASGVAKVVQKIFQPAPSPNIASQLPQHAGVSEFAARRGFRIALRHTFVDSFLLRRAQIMVDLFLEFFVTLAPETHGLAHFLCSRI